MCPCISPDALLAHAGADVENNVTVAYTSDKGLCGGINSTVTKYTRGVIRATEGGEQFPSSAMS